MQPLPPLLALPIELKLQIFTHLSNHSYGLLWLTILRRTHPLLRPLIPRQPMPIPMPRASLRPPSYHDFLQKVDLRMNLLRLTDSDHPYLFPPGFYPCFLCGEVVDCGRLDSASCTAASNGVTLHRLGYEGPRCDDDPYLWCIVPGDYEIPD